MANPPNTEKEKDWRGLKLTPIVENEDGSNNYSVFSQKSFLDLNAAGYWKFIAGDDYNPPVIPELIPSLAEAWLQTEKKAHTVLVKAIPDTKLYIVRDCKSAHDVWMTLKNEYEPSNALTAVTIKQQIIGYQCAAHDDPVNWREVMLQLYGKLREVDPFMMPDTEFAKHLILSPLPPQTRSSG
ncbi:hypothetical protein DFH07DRAFT_768592 [Mycena maculata]|uniref:Uncharacterized protein n=1 Tax=Mycena maculata TaxID=230809 RepID=A0AAD7JUL1_9AGAR|nr:hypothetical protein DFH07DRAFT_768592 [Mycena maculata]